MPPGVAGYHLMLAWYLLLDVADGLWVCTVARTNKSEEEGFLGITSASVKLKFWKKFVS